MAIGNMVKLGDGLFVAGLLVTLKTCVFAASDLYQWPFFLGIGLMLSGVVIRNYSSREK